jgi:hypothetical protein
MNVFVQKDIITHQLSRKIIYFKESARCETFSSDVFWISLAQDLMHQSIFQKEHNNSINRKIFEILNERLTRDFPSFQYQIDQSISHKQWYIWKIQQILEIQNGNWVLISPCKKSQLKNQYFKNNKRFQGIY